MKPRQDLRYCFVATLCLEVPVSSTSPFACRSSLFAVLSEGRALLDALFSMSCGDGLSGDCNLSPHCVKNLFVHKWFMQLLYKGHM